MTGFSSWLDAQPRLPAVDGVQDVLALVRLYRKTLPLRMPENGARLAEYRKKRVRPSGRIVVTDDVDVSDGLLAVSNTDYPLLIEGYRRYDFSPLFGLPVLYLMPDRFWAMDIAHQIADASPSAYSLIWPNTQAEEVVWN
jgi:hypothetical protein